MPCREKWERKKEKKKEVTDRDREDVLSFKWWKEERKKERKS